MSEHGTTWLDAYFDGELEGRRLSSAEEHLSHCENCQKELKALNGLSALLQSHPGPEKLLSSDQFVDRVRLRMPRLPNRPISQKVLSMAWQITPLGIFGLWSFMQAVFITTGILIIVMKLGFGSDTLASLIPSSQSGLGLGDLFSLQGANQDEILQTTLDFLSAGGPFGWGLIVNLGMSFILGILSCSWLTSWWIRTQTTNKMVTFLSINGNGK